MTNARNHFDAESRKQRLLREALVDIQAFVPIAGAANGAHPAQPVNVPCRPNIPAEESTMQAQSDNDEVKRYRVIGIGIPAAILLSVAAGLMTINASAPVSTARAHIVAAATHAVPDASTVFDTSAVVEPLPPTF